MRGLLFASARSILLGWVTLLLSGCVLERPLLWMAKPVAVNWLPTVHLALECAVLAATGWVIGRFSRPTPQFAVLVFAATLTFLHPGQLRDVNVPWLLQLAGDALHDSRYWPSLANTTMIHVLLFASLFAGALLSRSRETPLSIRQ